MIAAAGAYTQLLATSSIDDSERQDFEFDLPQRSKNAGLPRKVRSAPTVALNDPIRPRIMISHSSNFKRLMSALGHKRTLIDPALPCSRSQLGVVRDAYLDVETGDSLRDGDRLDLAQ